MVLCRTANRNGVRGIALAAAACAIGSRQGLGQWITIHLQPAGQVESIVYCLRPGQAGGYSEPTITSGLLPTIWGVPSGTMLSLAPSASVGGIVFGMSDNTEAGAVSGHAALWRGNASSFVDLHPANPNIFYSEAHAIRGAQQTGYVAVVPGGAQHAAMWNGAASSFRDLHPLGATNSQALATNGTLQGGWASFFTGGGSAQHAGIWNSSAASFQDLNPGPNFASVITGMWEDQQVGMYMPFGGPQHAAMWSGTAASLVDLNPNANSTSYLYATAGVAQAGVWNTTQGSHAAVWFSASSTVVDLSVYLPAAYRAESIAYAVIESNGQVIVGGYARSPGGAKEAFVWVPAPASPPAIGTPGVLTGARRRP